MGYTMVNGREAKYPLENQFTKNRIESRINEEIRLAAEKEAEYRREKGVQHEYNIKPESYDKELKEAQQKLEKIQQIEQQIQKIEEKELRRSSQSRLSQSRLSNSDQDELTAGETQVEEVFK